MFYDLNTLAQLASARRVMPKWMARIYDYNGLELHPVRVAGYGPNGAEIMVPCRPPQASLWAVYGHFRYPRPKDNLEVIDDFKTEREARHFREQLLYCFPHLRAYRQVTLH
jgi:hypothetical protein